MKLEEEGYDLYTYRNQLKGEVVAPPKVMARLGGLWNVFMSCLTFVCKGKPFA